jgi:hypothetical protein
MYPTDVGRDSTRELARPGPIGLAIRVILGATVIYSLVALLTKWNGFLDQDPIESDRYYTLATLWLLPHVLLHLPAAMGPMAHHRLCGGRSGARARRVPGGRGVLEPGPGGSDVRG